jgi:hypothetical protein
MLPLCAEISDLEEPPKSDGVLPALGAAANRLPAPDESPEAEPLAAAGGAADGSRSAEQDPHIGKDLSLKDEHVSHLQIATIVRFTVLVSHHAEIVLSYCHWFCRLSISFSAYEAIVVVPNIIGNY